MFKNDYELWVRYRTGQLNHQLTEQEYSEIRACEFAMHLLVPSEQLLDIVGGFDELKKIASLDPIRRYFWINDLSNIFCVEREVIRIKIGYILKYENPHINKNNNKSKENYKILKKKDNIIYVDFNG